MNTLTLWLLAQSIPAQTVPLSLSQQLTTLALQALILLSPAVLTLIGALAARLMSLASKSIKDKRVALAMQLATAGAADIVADVFQHSVQALKDPSKPGRWDEVTAAAAKLRAMQMLRTLHAPAVAVLTQALNDPGRVEQILGTLVERAVVDLNAKVKPSASPVNVVNVTTPTPAQTALSEGETMFPPAAEPIAPVEPVSSR